MKKIYSILIIASYMVTGLLAQTQETIVTPSKDNSIYSEGELSNGAGQNLFTGLTRGGNKRRALIKFDLAETLPDGVTVDSAHLIIVPSKVKTAERLVNIHQLSGDWGEGSSNAEGQEGKGAAATDGDATWTKSVFNGDLWGNAGGDFGPDILASANVTMGSDALFASPLLTEAVKTWIDDPARNHGVILLGDESENSTSVRFYSREFSDSEKWPKLVLYYQGATSIIDEKLSAANMLVYPDLHSAALIIRNDYGPLDSRVELYSITGALLLSTQEYLSEGDNKIPTRIEGSGVYLYRVISSAGIVSGKFIRQ